MVNLIQFPARLVPSAQQDDYDSLSPREIHAVTGSDVDTQFTHAIAHRSHVAEIS
jgi:hypothetical protein